MGDEPNGHGMSRLDRIERALELLIDDHVQFREDHKRLLTAQVVLAEAQARTEQKMQEAFRGIDELREQQKHTDARMDALIAVVDDLIRKRPINSIAG
jgi:hypothetical protein